MWPGPGPSLVLFLLVMTAGLIAHRLDERRANAAPVPQLREQLGARVTVGIRLGQTPSSVRAFEATLDSVGRRSRRVRFSDVASVGDGTADAATLDGLERDGVLAHRIVWLQAEDGARVDLA